MIRTRAEQAADIARIALRAIEEKHGRALRGIIPSSIDSSYSSGNPKTKRPGESAAANAEKQVIGVYGVAPITASARAAEIPFGDGTFALGTPLDVTSSSLITYAKLQLVFGYAFPVTPGNTNTHLTANTEHSKTGAGMDSYSDVKRFYLGRPGRYRVSLQLSRTGGSTTSAKLQLELPDGTRVDASAEASSTTTNPSFSSHNVDMTITANHAGMFLVVQYKGTLTAQTAYIKNCVVKSDDATTLPALYEVVITD